MPSNDIKKILQEWMVDMRDRWKLLIAIILGTVAGTVAGTFLGFDAQDKQPEYTIVEDNAVETIISVDKGDEITLLSINRFEDGGGLWEVTYDGKSEPKTRRVE